MFMVCKTCEDLFAAYSHHIRVFTNAVLNIPGVLSDDSRVTPQELERLGQNCRAANNALMAHLRHDHGKR